METYDCESDCNSYYFQEDSSDDSANAMDEESRITPTQTIHVTQEGPRLNRSQSNATQPHFQSKSSATSSSSASSSSSTPSLSPKPTSPNGASPKATSPKKPGAQHPLKANSSPEQQISTSILKTPIKLSPQLTEDARSLAVAIEDQEMLSRSDLEESLLRNLFSPVKSLESEVQRLDQC